MNNNIDAMKLNAIKDKDDNFNSSIKYDVAEYIGDEVPKVKRYYNLKDAIVASYRLFLEDELQSISVVDRKGNVDSTDALNYFTDSNKINNENLQEIGQLKKENELLMQFLQENKAVKLFEDFKSKNKI